MNALATWKIIAATTVILVAACHGVEPSKELQEVDGPNVRVMRHQDGGTTMFIRTPDNLKLTKKKYSAGGVLTMRTVYLMDANKNPLGCKIFDGQDQLLFKVSYGYRSADGQLVEERMFDARVVRKDPNTGKEMPIQRICYTYDTQGNRSAPIVFNLLPGKTFEQVFGIKSSALETNPFKNEPSGGGPIKPKARPPQH